MGNNENWVNKLIDELIDSKEDVVELRVQVEKYVAFVDALLDVARLSTYGDVTLYFNDISEIVKMFFPDEYKNRLNELLECEKAEDAAKAAAAAEAALDSDNSEV